MKQGGRGARRQRGRDVGREAGRWADLHVILATCILRTHVHGYISMAVHKRGIHAQVTRTKVYIGRLDVQRERERERKRERERERENERARERARGFVVGLLSCLDSHRHVPGTRSKGILAAR